MIDQIINNKNTYFTPKTYGIEGLSINGFDINSIFVAGSNIGSFQKIHGNTYGLFLFHIKRSILSAIFLAIGYKKYGVENENTLLALDNTYLTVSQIKNLSDIEGILPTPSVIPWYITAPPSNIIIILLYLYSVIKAIARAILDFLKKCGISKVNNLFFTKTAEPKTMFMSGPSIAKSVAVVLKGSPFIANPPPLPLEQLSPAISEEVKQNILKTNAKIFQYTKSLNAHQVADFKRLLLDATELVYAASVACIDRLVIYDPVGTLNQNINLVAKSVKQKFDISKVGSSLSIPDIIIIFPSNKKQIKLYDGKIQVENLENDVFDAIPETPKSPHYTKFLEVVVLEKSNGKPFIFNVFQKVCSMIEQGLVKPEELESTMTAIYKESFIYPPVDLVITSGLLKSLEGIPPPLIKGSSS
ncbi:hypothetical protein D0Z00_002630 [Geotrichum galactomycetum]|uniref:Uncharacterized protein n=1 Tax=Geotrichum galactomycetum TaxID=27317 RepID=A0ACB6V3R3_9ASCO|nr:hypothetical protein D0Z00_002630 [Geotrichum candidum]